MQGIGNVSGMGQQRMGGREHLGKMWQTSECKRCWQDYVEPCLGPASQGMSLQAEGHVPGQPAGVFMSSIQP